MTPVERAHLAALAGFDHMTSARLRALVTGRDPSVGFAIASGAARAVGPIGDAMAKQPELRKRWQRSAAAMPPERMGEWCAALGVEIVVPGDPGFPAQLLDDPRRPEVLFVRGDLGCLDTRRVGIVGTRNPTRRGAQTAARFGHELSEASVAVVSGLALGVDGAAHRGTLASATGVPIAVVANGHDRPYPRRHDALWGEVAERGVVMSEWPPGTAPERFRFPQRNRILAAISELVVVVESRRRGGSLITAREAAERGVDVFAVPGPIDEPACEGTNALLDVGAAPVSSTDTLLVALGLDGRRARRSRFDPRSAPTGTERRVLDMCRTSSQRLESVAVALGVDLADAAMALARLERAGWVSEVAGWFEAVDEYADLV